MLFTILISVALVVVVFAIANKYTKKTEQPTIPTVNEEPLGYETSSICEVVEREQPTVELIAPEIVIDKEPEEQPKPKAKKKMSAKPKTSKAPKKKKDA